MAQNPPRTRQYKDVQLWPKGCNSFGDPQIIEDTQARWAVNAVCRGGLWQTRPGYKTRVELLTTPGTPFGDWWISVGSPKLHPQAFTIFSPTNSDPWLVCAVNGAIFIAPANHDGTFGTIRQVQGLQFDATAPFLVFQPTVQSADIVNGRVVPITPRNVLMIQDGTSRAGYWTGLSARHLNPQKRWSTNSAGDTIFAGGYNQTRIGLWMAWSGNRLWTFDGTQGHASDLNNPLYFTEETVLTQVPVFNFPYPVTGAIDRGTSGVQQNLVFVMMGNSVETLRSGVQDRALWTSTGDFQKTIFKGVGCVAGKSIINHRGLLHWYSADGVVSFDSLGTVISTQSLPAVDYEMSYSKRRMSPDRVGICAGYRDSYVFWSVPVGPTTNGRVYNGQTQVLDKSILPAPPETAGAIPGTIEGWQGVWTGIRPVEWATGDLFGQTRVLTLSMDGDGIMRVWEAFQGNRADNGQQIPWTIETKTHPVTGTPFNEAVFRYFKIILEQIYGNLSLIGSYKGLRGQYHELLDTVVTATPGSILLDTPQFSPIRFATSNESFAKQSRQIVSQNSTDPGPGVCQSREVESPLGDDVDRAFSLLLQFRGVGALLAYRLASDTFVQDTEGAVTEAETGLHILPEALCPEFIESDLPTFKIEDSPLADALTPFLPHFIEEEYFAPPP